MFSQYNLLNDICCTCLKSGYVLFHQDTLLYVDHVEVMYFGKLLKLVIFYICGPQNSPNVPLKSRYVTLNKPRCLIATGAQLRFSYEAFHRQWLNLQVRENVGKR